MSSWFGSMSTILAVATPQVIRHPSGIAPRSRTDRCVFSLSWCHGGPGRTAVGAGFAGRRRAPGRDVLRHPDPAAGGPAGARPRLGGPGRVPGRDPAPRHGAGDPHLTRRPPGARSREALETAPSDAASVRPLLARAARSWAQATWTPLAHAIIIVRRLIRRAWTCYRWQDRPSRRP
jgi:hypothetical protein